MKKTTMFLAAIFAFCIVFSQEKNKTRVIMMKVKPDMTMEFEKGLAAHIAKYHPQATDPVSIWNVLSGSRTGEYHYIQGGLDWAGMEGKDYPADHREDWNKNAGKYVESSEVHYLSHNDGYSYNEPEGPGGFAIVDFVTVNPGTYGTYLSMMETRKEAMEKGKDSRHLSVFMHSFTGSEDFNFAEVWDLTGGLKDLDMEQVPMSKVLNDNIHPWAQQEMARNSLISVKKRETFLARRNANLSSK